MSEILSISRHRMGTDGQGVTTLVAFYGCPLACRYCINRGCSSPDAVRAHYTPEQLVERLAVDEPYFLMTQGGVTFGGGEPLLQTEFIRQTCTLIGSRWKKRMETSLYARWQDIEPLTHHIDEWFVDIKAADPAVYRQYTGRDNGDVRRNLKKLVDRVGPEKVCVRCPVIPDFTDEEDREQGIARLLSEIHPALRVERFTYIRR